MSPRINSHAQSPVTLRTVIRDSVSGRPVSNVVVELRSPRGTRTERADESGSAQFLRVESGAYSIVMLRIGYRARSTSVLVGTRDTIVNVSVSAIATELANIQVRANAQEIFGVIAGMPDLRPVAGAKVDLANAKLTTMSDSSGNYVFHDLKAGQYVLRITADGFAPRIATLTIPRGKATESSHVLDTGIARTNALAAAWFDMDRRVAMRGFNSVIIPSEELLRHSGTLQTALLFSQDFAAKGFRFTRGVCVFLNGRPMPGFDLNSFNAEEIAMIEVYSTGDRSDPTALMKQWPSGTPCGASGGGTTGSTSQRQQPGALPVEFVVIWTK